MYVPEIHEQRKKISGLKMPRRLAPKLPGPSTKGQAPVNPYLGNKMKVASLSDFRDLQIERELLKTASLSEEMLYYEMKKVAEYGSEEEILFMLQQYSDMEKEISVRLASENNKVKIEFSDKGIGIPENQLDTIFKKFYRVNSTRMDGIGGAGLGLTVVKEIIESHHGKILVDSKLNKGRTFTVWLPSV